MIGPLGRLRAAAAFRQHCPQMTQRRCSLKIEGDLSGWSFVRAWTTRESRKNKELHKVSMVRVERWIDIGY